MISKGSVTVWMVVARQVFDGLLNFTIGTGVAHWYGCGVVQSNHRIRPERPSRDGR
jgi:hypothetical protein